MVGDAELLPRTWKATSSRGRSSSSRPARETGSASASFRSVASWDATPKRLLLGRMPLQRPHGGGRQCPPEQDGGIQAAGTAADDGLTAVVTGARRGIGRATALALADPGEARRVAARGG